MDISGDPKTIGSDAPCLYVAGTIGLIQKSGSRPSHLVGCGTVIAGKAVLIYRHEYPKARGCGRWPKP